MSTQTEPTNPPISTFLREPLRVGDPDVAGALAVYPVFGPEPRLEYLSFAQAQGQGARIGELEDGASVNDLLVENPTPAPVLLFEGEEVLGAQQNRTFDVTVLVPAGAKLRVPVSCLEAGRWDGRRHREHFRAAPQTVFPDLRAAKARHVRERAGMGLEARADQGEVWREVAGKAARMDVASPTAAMHDVYENRRDRLHEMLERIRLRPDQCGAIAAIGGELRVLDHFSRPDVFAGFHGPLVQGYTLDALEVAANDAPAEAPPVEAARGFALLASDCEPAQCDRGMGLGETLRFDANGVAGSALVNEDELVQLTAFVNEGDDGQHPSAARAGRVRRPSRRR